MFDEALQKITEGLHRGAGHITAMTDPQNPLYVQPSRKVKQTHTDSSRLADSIKQLKARLNEHFNTFKEQRLQSPDERGSATPHTHLRQASDWYSLDEEKISFPSRVLQSQQDVDKTSSSPPESSTLQSSSEKVMSSPPLNDEPHSSLPPSFRLEKATIERKIIDNFKESELHVCVCNLQLLRTQFEESMAQLALDIAAEQLVKMRDLLVAAEESLLEDEGGVRTPLEGGGIAAKSIEDLNFDYHECYGRLITCADTAFEQFFVIGERQISVRRLLSKKKGGGGAGHPPWLPPSMGGLGGVANSVASITTSTPTAARNPLFGESQDRLPEASDDAGPPIKLFEVLDGYSFLDYLQERISSLSERLVRNIIAPLLEDAKGLAKDEAIVVDCSSDYTHKSSAAHSSAKEGGEAKTDGGGRFCLDGFNRWSWRVVKLKDEENENIPPSSLDQQGDGYVRGVSGSGISRNTTKVSSMNVGETIAHKTRELHKRVESGDSSRASLSETRLSTTVSPPPAVDLKEKAALDEGGGFSFASPRLVSSPLSLHERILPALDSLVRYMYENFFTGHIQALEIFGGFMWSVLCYRLVFELPPPPPSSVPRVLSELRDFEASMRGMQMIKETNNSLEVSLRSLQERLHVQERIDALGRARELILSKSMKTIKVPSFKNFEQFIRYVESIRQSYIITKSEGAGKGKIQLVDLEEDSQSATHTGNAAQGGQAVTAPLTPDTPRDSNAEGSFATNHQNPWYSHDSSSFRYSIATVVAPSYHFNFNPNPHDLQHAHESQSSSPTLNQYHQPNSLSTQKPPSQNPVASNSSNLPLYQPSMMSSDSPLKPSNGSFYGVTPTPPPPHYSSPSPPHSLSYEEGERRASKLSTLSSWTTHTNPPQEKLLERLLNETDSFMGFSACSVSSSTHELVSMFYATLDAACVESKLSLSNLETAKELLLLMREMASLFLLLRPAAHKYSLLSDPLSCALFYSDCSYVAYNLMAIPFVYRNLLKKVLPRHFYFLDLISSLRKMQESFLLNMMSKQTQEIIQLAAVFSEFKDISFDEAYLSYEFAAIEAIDHIVSLLSSWKGILPDYLFLDSASALVEGFIRQLVNQVISLPPPDYSEVIAIVQLLNAMRWPLLKLTRSIELDENPRDIPSHLFPSAYSHTRGQTLDETTHPLSKPPYPSLSVDEETLSYSVPSWEAFALLPTLLEADFSTLMTKRSDLTRIFKREELKRLLEFNSNLCMPVESAMSKLIHVS